MSTLPSLVGFSVRIAPEDVPPPARLAVAGTRLPLQAKSAGTVLSGTGVSPRGEAAQGRGGLAADGDVAVVLAGELYQRDALVAAAAVSSAGTDAELLLACYQRYGPAAFRLLNGRFAALVLAAGQVVLATDHAASVPLYIRTTARAVEVSTEAKALARPQDSAVVDGHADLAGTVPVAGSPGLHRLRAGTVALCDRPAPGRAPATRAMRTWTPPVSRIMMEPDRAAAAVADRLAVAVRTRLAGEAPTLVLSGGIDSSALAALVSAVHSPARTVSMGTDVADEFEAARVVASHLGTEHTELTVPARDLLRELPFAVAAAEINDPDVLEYLLPLVALYRRLPGPPRRILTGYGADIPLGGMHRTVTSLAELDEIIADDMSTFDGLNELSPVLSGVAGHWSTHPYWDRDVLDLLVALEPGLKRRDGLDKWVLRVAMADRLPLQTWQRRKLGIHEGSGLNSTWSQALREAGVPPDAVGSAKRAMARQLYASVVLSGTPADEIDVDMLLMRMVG
jgi:(carboxyethyl)arginine beta-lactam-synthase